VQCSFLEYETASVVLFSPGGCHTGSTAYTTIRHSYHKKRYEFA